MKILAVLFATMGLSAFAAKEVNVPAANILKASRQIIAQTGPWYEVEGKISCSTISTGWGPTTSSCVIFVKGGEKRVSNAAKIIEAVKKVNPPRGPVYQFDAAFKARSVSQEFPPYKITETATITLK